MATNSVVYLAIVTGDPVAKVIADSFIGNNSDGGGAISGIEKIKDLLTRLQSGIEPGKVLVAQDKCDGTAATGTFACTQATITAGDTCKIGNIVFTAKAAPSSEPSKGEFAFLTSDTITGAALAAAINAHPECKGMCTAANGSGTVTVTMVDKGLFGNLVDLVGSTGIVATDPTNGAEGTMQSHLRVFRRGL